MKPIRIIKVQTETAQDVQGRGIPKGTRLAVMKEGPKHPTEGYKLLVVRVDNGTGHWDLCPETCIRSSEVK
jgi:hypothetical protein